MRISDRKVEHVANLEDFRRVVTSFSTWFGVALDGTILLMRDTGTQEVYALDFRGSLDALSQSSPLETCGLQPPHSKRNRDGVRKPAYLCVAIPA